MTEPKTKKCEVCGARKPLSDFSKSYKNRCRACVAAEARMHRASEAEELNRIKPKLKEGLAREESQIMYYKKAYIKTTGEVVAVTPCDETMHTQTHCFKTRDGRIIPQLALQFAHEINWEQRKYEIARDVMALQLANIRLSCKDEFERECVNELIAEVAKTSVKCASLLIDELILSKTLKDAQDKDLL